MNPILQPSQILRYGNHADQFIELLNSAANTVSGTVVLIHGGYWRQRITAEVMHPIARQLVGSGWNVANLEYRRGPGHRWPIPVEDAAQALDLLRTHFHDPSGPLILLGHSVGGQLALLNSTSADAVVTLAPVTDVDRVYQEDLGEAAATEYFGITPAQNPELYTQASPIRQPALRVPLLIVHGSDDDRLPLEHSREYIRTMNTPSGIETAFFEELDHFKIIDPTECHWPRVLTWLDLQR